jgi:Dna[CI] antecedent, DciA
MIPIHRFMPDAIAAVLRKAPLTPEKIAFAWRTAVGPSVDRATSVALHGSTLRVHAKDPQWRREIEHSAGLIRARLDALLGPGVVRGLDVTVD